MIIIIIMTTIKIINLYLHGSMIEHEQIIKNYAKHAQVNLTYY